MVQFYCLSVVMNIFAGLILVYGADLTKNKALKQVDETTVPGTVDGSLEQSAQVGEVVAEGEIVPSKKRREFNGLGSRSVRFLIGIASVLVGFVKLFSSYGGIVILGDLLPAVAGLMGGISILLEYYMVTTSDNNYQLNEKLRGIFIDSRRYIGVLCFLSALLHFVLPKVIIL